MNLRTLHAPALTCPVGRKKPPPGGSLVLAQAVECGLRLGAGSSAEPKFGEKFPGFADFLGTPKKSHEKKS